MIKVMVVIWGLVMFVPGEVQIVGGEPVTQEITVVFTNPRGQGMAHRPQMWILDAQGNLTRSDLTGDFQMRLVGATGTAGIPVRVRDDFPRIEVLDPTRRILEVCRTNQTQCKDMSTNHDLVSGTATLTGVWTTRPASICDHRLPLPVVYKEPALFSYRETEQGQPMSPVPRGIATALVLETTVQTVEGFVKLNGGGRDLIELSPTLCRKWIPSFSGSKCAVLVIGNPPATPMRCPNSICRLHGHFSTFYDVATNSNGKEWLPYVETGEDCPEGDGVTLEVAYARPGTPGMLIEPPTKPAVRCPPTFASPEEGAAVN